jgi:predicted nuclease of predicted toxin-antitoxin system
MIKILLDQNLSFKIKKEIKDVFSEVKHVSDTTLSDTDDLNIWRYAKINDFSIIKFDSDFIDISTIYGFPPKIIWLRMGNSTTVKVVQIIRNNQFLITEFLSNHENGCLELY